MISDLTIKNYKSIVEDSMSISNVNVLIGENGSGKTNYLEAVAMLSAAQNFRLDISGFSEKGIRVTKPRLTTSSFLGKRRNKTIEIELLVDQYPLKSLLLPKDEEDIYSEWVDKHSDKIYVENLGKYIDSEKWIEQFIIDTISKDPNISHSKKIINQIKENVKNRLVREDVKAITPKSFLDFTIFNLETQSLRGIQSQSKIMPLGIYGEGLDVLLSDFSEEEWEELLQYKHLISWLEDFFIDEKDQLKFKGHKLGRSTSILYFRDKFMSRKNNVFAAENSNEGILHILFYLALFISKKTPPFFAIDNIETALNPKLCRTLMKEIAQLAIKNNKQALITTHNPAILDGLNLHDDRQRLFVIKRTDEGYTKSERIKLKPQTNNGKKLKLSEMWMRGYLGGLPTNF